MFWMWLISKPWLKRVTLALPSIWATAFLLCGCSIATAPATIEAGNEFQWINVRKITEGMESSEVHRLLGNPLSIVQVEGGAHWRYYYRVRQQDVVRFLGIFPYRKTFSHWEREVGLLLRDGRVEKLTVVMERDLIALGNTGE